MGNFIGNYYYNNNNGNGDDPQEDERRPSDNYATSPSSSSPYHSASIHPSSSGPRVVSAQLESMSQRVKEVLPQVPLDVIRRDVSITANVDETITRLLDGTVTYKPEEPLLSSNKTSLAPLAQSSSPLLNNRNLPIKTGAASFGKNSNERMRSFEERKKLLIEESKLRYMIKHGLIITDDTPIGYHDDSDAPNNSYGSTTAPSDSLRRRK